MRKGLFYKYISFLLNLGWVLTFGAGISLCQNLPPVFATIPNCIVSIADTEELQLSGGVMEGGTFTTCYVAERETLEVYVYATDPDGDSVNLSVLNAPSPALFSDLGNGKAKLFWVPEFVGLWSSAGSPFELFFEASDESSSSRLRVVINVINVNRNPELFLPDSSEVVALNQLVFQVGVRDLDSEEVTIEVLNAPSGSSWDQSSGIFTWTPQLADTGLRLITFRATDQSGGECVQETKIVVVKPSSFSLRLGTVDGLLGSVVEIPISLNNSDLVAGMELSIKLDPLEYTFLSISRKGCRTENWEYFVCREKTVGQNRMIKIIGIADFPNQVSVVPLLPDSGVVAYLMLRLTTDPNLSGFLLPLEFFAVNFTDNTLSTHRGKFIPRMNINLTNGGALLNPANTVIGDVNQNGIAYEIGDAVKLAAYLSGRATLTSQQLINSDVNQDGRMATLSDLVLLINRILEEGATPVGDDVNPNELAVVRIIDNPLQNSIWLESENPVGGALIVFKGENLRIENLKLAPSAQDLELHTSQVGDELRVLVISPEAKPLPAGDGPLFSFEGEGFDSIQISLANPEGELIKVNQQHEHNSLPARHTLDQNYPNPFNPETGIKYSVGGDASVQVSLRVYNVAGQLVKILVDQEKLPGQYEETWNGKNENNEDVASGIYFYKLNIANYVETKKMVLLR